MRRINALVLAVLFVASAVVPHALKAQAAQLCFNVPGITNCIEGRFRQYWEQNGGLPVFGYPLTAATMEQTAEGSFLTQYFERNRFELHPEKARPYDVLLGRLGDVRLTQQGRDWQSFGMERPTSGCLFFRETGHNVCDLEAGIGFKSYWESHGLQDPALTRFQRSLALFGLPLSELTVETNATGDTVITQWFERARFEYHLNKPREFRVLLGLLGGETRNPPPASPSALPPLEPNPSDECTGITGPENAIAVPDCVKFGEALAINVFGFQANQQISFRITNQAGTVVGGSQSVQANRYGNAAIEINTRAYSGTELRPGNYVLIAEDGQGNKHVAKASFRVLQ